MQVGTVVGTHGYDGRLRVQSETDNPDRFRKGASVRIGAETYTVASVARATGGALLLKLDGVDTREAAAALLHELVIVGQTDVPDLPEDTYYHYQLLGMTVVTAEGTLLGTLTEVISTGANDVYVVTSPESELLVPAIADVVVEVDVAHTRMTVAVPEGLEPRPLTANRPPKRRPPRRRPRQRKNGPADAASPSSRTGNSGS